MPDLRGATDLDLSVPDAYRCPDCGGLLDEHGAAWTCRHCQLTQLRARCHGCGGKEWMIAGKLPIGWIQLSTHGTLGLACCSACATTVATTWAARRLVTALPTPPATPPAGPPPAAGV